MIEQRTDEWHKQRAGRITGSRFADAMAMDKRNPLKSTESRNKYLREIVAEIISGEPPAEIDSRPLAWGRDAEPIARSEYEDETGNIVKDAGFTLHPQYDFVGASPDGLVGADGIIEIKCPYSREVHVRTMLEGDMPSEHMAQVQGVMWVTGRQWCDFISYRPDFPEEARMFVKRIERDDAYIADMEQKLLRFWEEVQAAVAKIKQRKSA